MGNKRKPAFVLANREYFAAMDYDELRKYRERVLVKLNKKADKLLKELVVHLVRMRVKHTVRDKEVFVFADADNWELRSKAVSFTPMFFSYPNVPNNRIRASFLKNLNSEKNTTWCRLKKVGILEPTYGFNTLAMAKELRDLRNLHLSKRKLAKIQANNINKSRALAKKLVIPKTKESQFSIYASYSDEHADKFELQITHLVTLAEAQAILKTLVCK